MAAAFQVAEAPWVTAVGDGTLLVVTRCLALSTTDPRYLPIASYIEDHGLVLFETATETSLFGGVELDTEVAWYATPSARNVLLYEDEPDAE